MCVIMIVDDDKKRPSRQMLEKAWNWNCDGAGVAWREENKKGEPEVVWEKGFMNAAGFEEIKDLVEQLPVPYVLHFRIASKNGGGVRQSLTHPFPVAVNTGSELSGRTKGYVLFHNGDWQDWHQAALNAALNKGVKIPTGKWNDSRAMAWLCSIYGLGFMELLPEQRGVAFGPKDMEVFSGKGWTRVNDIWCSNDNFLHMSRGGNTGYVGGVCSFGKCRRFDNLVEGRCPEHRHVNSVDVYNGKGSSEVGSNTTPFPQIPTGAIIKLEVAERLHQTKNEKGERILSKGVIRSIRKGYSRMGEGGKKGERAKEDLRYLTSQLISSGRLRLTVPKNGAE